MTTLSEALAPRSDQLNADDLIPGPRVLKITGARVSSEDRQKRMVLSYEGDQGKPWKPCKTMGRAMVMVWGITDDGFEQQLIGKSIRVYRDPEVRFGDQGQVGGIRISHMSHIDKPVPVKLTVSQGKKSVFTFHPLVTDAGGGKKVDAGVSAEATAMIAKINEANALPALSSLMKELDPQIEPLSDDDARHVFDAANVRKAALKVSPKRASFDADDDVQTGRSDADHGDQHPGDDAGSVAGDLGGETE